MRISYNWLHEYLPERIEVERLSKILTAIGLEVESLEKYEEIKGGLKGLLIGEVLETRPHPNADKLTLTRVDAGKEEALQIVCGAPNVAKGQKVVIAPVGATIYPVQGEPLTMRVAKIRGEESYGMICAEDEIGMGSSHEGIMVLAKDASPGMAAPDYFKLHTDWVFEIGITPNRMDAMSHLGVARDVCAYLSYHEKKDSRVKTPYKNNFKEDNSSLPIKVTVEDPIACPRYSGISISNITVKESPGWLKQRLKSIGIRPINNIVDITNFIQHESGQPLHAFDADKIKNNHVIVKKLPEGTSFVTLDEKERKLNAEDLMICDSEGPMCIAGVFGGIHSGVAENTRQVFLESAYFNPVSIRKTSFRHTLRTDAATRFEKGIDISNTVQVLKRAALLIKEITGGEISSAIIDVFPQPEPKKEIGLKYHFLKKLSGKSYHPDAVKHILQSLGFEVIKERIDELWVAAPYHKPDISLPADLVEEILRIDGLDNIEIGGSITITPSIEEHDIEEKTREKVADMLAGSGFNQIITNSITNSAYYEEASLNKAVKMLNNLSEDLDVMRLSLLETGLETIAYNLNRKNNSLFFYELGKVYETESAGKYQESEHLLLLATGDLNQHNWRNKTQPADVYYLKGVADNIQAITGVKIENYETMETSGTPLLKGFINRHELLVLGNVADSKLQQFDIKQPVVFADFNWELLTKLKKEQKISFTEIPRLPAVQRDLALVVDNELPFKTIEESISKLHLPKLKTYYLFDVFENEKLGAGKKSLAISFTFQDNDKTLTDKEIDGWMNKLISSFEKNLGAEIRK